MFGHESVGQYVFEQGLSLVCGSGTERQGFADDSRQPRASLSKAGGSPNCCIPGACDGNMSNYFIIYAENGKTGSEKKFRHNVIPGEDYAAQPYLVAIITPVIRCCEGGLEIDENSAVLGAGSKPVSGLNATCEVAGGVHSDNCLGGTWSRNSKSWCRHPPLIPWTPPNLQCWRSSCCCIPKSCFVRRRRMLLRRTSKVLRMASMACVLRWESCVTSTEEVTKRMRLQARKAQESLDCSDFSTKRQ